VAGGSNGGVNGFNAIEDGGDIKRGIKGGNDGGVSNGDSRMSPDLLRGTG
jgi:hypothetical protein